ncbi:DUF1194 domain-containing protein [Methylocapsa sp. S129]|uniref:DUF1194 domain-containing protein n=1 Tax=Methylocapsa sp. S129 TaxID=1641869 RepID=UPI00131E03DD|nr:DUF1194 domain-containing protein [Methylocapsa sp. S129]
MRFLHVCTIFAATMLALAAIGPSARAAQAVDVALVLAADVSRSINDEEFGLQQRGYAAAITSARLLEAIRSGAHGAIAVSFVEWAGEAEQKTVVDWTLIRDEADARKFADALRAAPRSYVGRTAIGSALDFATGLMEESGFAADRLVIDVSGDGTSNQGRSVTEARDAAVKAGATINGLSIFNQRAAGEGGYLALHTNPPGGLAQYYRDHVIGGPGAFVLPIDDFNSFGEAMIHKLVNEVAAMPGADRRKAARQDSGARRFAALPDQGALSGGP